MIDEQKFNTRFDAKVKSAQSNVLALAKLVTNNPARVSSDVVKDLSILEALITSLQEFSFALLTKNENGDPNVEADDSDDDASADTDPANVIPGDSVATSSAGS